MAKLWAIKNERGNLMLNFSGQRARDAWDSVKRAWGAELPELKKLGLECVEVAASELTYFLKEKLPWFEEFIGDFKPIAPRETYIIDGTDLLIISRIIKELTEGKENG